MAELTDRVAKLESEIQRVNQKLFPKEHPSEDFKFSNGSFFKRKGKQLHPDSREGRVIESILERQRSGNELDAEQQKELDEVREEIAS